jgi:hypothetical protein
VSDLVPKVVERRLCEVYGTQPSGSPRKGCEEER